MWEGVLSSKRLWGFGGGLQRHNAYNLATSLFLVLKLFAGMHELIASSIMIMPDMFFCLITMYRAEWNRSQCIFVVLGSAIVRICRPFEADLFYLRLHGGCTCL